MRRPTIRDIAREVQVSKSTVANILSGTGRASARTRERVLAAADRLGYVPNRAARNLRTRSTGAIGISIPPIVRGFSFYMHVTFGAVQAASEHGFDLLVLSRDEQGGAGPGEPQPRPFAIDGAIIVDPLDDDPTALALLDHDAPLVTLGHFLEHDRAAERVTTVVEAPHARLLTEILDALFEHGVRQPALLGLSDTFYSSWADDVSRGYAAWCERRGVLPRVSAIDVAADRDVLREHVRGLVDDAVDALICAPQGFAARTLPVLGDLGRELGDDMQLVSLVGDPTTEMTDVRITAIDLAPWQFGYETGELLVRIAKGEAVPAHVEHAASIRWGSVLARASSGRRLDDVGGRA